VEAGRRAPTETDHGWGAIRLGRTELTCNHRRPVAMAAGTAMIWHGRISSSAWACVRRARHSTWPPPAAALRSPPGCAFHSVHVLFA